MNDEDLDLAGVKARSSAESGVGIVVLVSEQVIPAMTFLLHLANQHGQQLRFIGLYHTTDEKRSEGPARRMQASLRRWGEQRNLGFQIERMSGDGHPPSIRTAMLHWFERADVDHWLINSTGGTKAMSLAAYEISRCAQIASRRVLYLENTGQWFEWSEDELGLMVDRELHSGVDVDVPPARALDELITIQELARVQFPLLDATINQNTPPVNFDILSVARSAAGANWNWMKALAKVDVFVSGKGEAFEVFVHEVLRQMGLRIAHSIKARSSNRISLAEMDLVVLHRGRAFCLDLKLPGQSSDDERLTQLSKCATDARQLFGSVAQPVAIRPGWPGTQEANATLPQAHALGVRVLNQTSMRALFSTLAQLIDPEIEFPPVVRELEALLQCHSGFSVLSHFGLLHGTIEDHVYSIPIAIQYASAFRSKPWCLVQMDGDQWRLYGMKSNPQTDSDIKWFQRPNGPWDSYIGGQWAWLEAEVGMLFQKLGVNADPKLMDPAATYFVWTIDKKLRGKNLRDLSVAVERGLTKLWESTNAAP